MTARNAFRYIPRGPGLAVRRLIPRLVVGFEMAVFACLVLLASPIILFKFAVDWVRGRIEDRWPESDRARAVSYWIGCLAPVAFAAILLVIVILAIGHVRALRDARS